MTSVSTHLRIRIDEYDQLIRAFVPGYETMLGVVAESLALLQKPTPTIVDLGIGTGALAARCLAARPDATLIGIDADAAMLEVARLRLQDYPGTRLQIADFLKTALPPCNAIVACISLHHIRSAQDKQAFYASCAGALGPGGLFFSADCFPARNQALATRQHEQWREHLEKSYSRTEAEAHLAAWAQEDTYFPLEDELSWLRNTGMQPDVVWRAGGFAVVMAARS